MRWRPLTWFLLSLLCMVGALYFWRLGDKWRAEQSAAHTVPAQKAMRAAPKIAKPATSASLGLLSKTARNSTVGTIHSTNRFPYRVSNTTRTVGQLLRNDHAILLENAIWDTTQPLSASIPDTLRAKGDPGSYIVQARQPLDNAFRALLKEAGATIVSYIPNNAYLVEMPASAVPQVAASPQTQTVLLFEPYYKLKPALLDLAVRQQPLPSDSKLNVVVFSDALDATLAALQQMGAQVMEEDRSPFGPVLTVQPKTDSLVALAGLSGVQGIDFHRSRVAANDLSRARVGVSADSVTLANYLDLSGSNVLVNVNDTGVDATHPDLLGRVFGDFASSLLDTDGHGTHVAGIIASSGGESLTVTNASGSIMPPTTNQFRGMAPLANVFSVSLNNSDSYLQETAARTNALISNNSWTYAGNDYDIEAASWDAAVRDALPGVTGSQPVVFVFAAGNSGNGSDDGSGVTPGSIQSPATAKNVITVGAIEQLRNITNDVELIISGQTNTSEPWQGQSDSDDQVAAFSSRGNVGVNIEGDFGRYKPDVVAPGTFVVSTRSSQWDQAAYYNPTNYSFNAFIDEMGANSLTNYIISVPYNAVEMIIYAFAIYPPVDIPIYVAQAGYPNPSSYDYTGVNTVEVPFTQPSQLNTFWFYAITNTSSQSLQYEIITEMVTTNDLGNYLEVLSNLNNQLGPYYRYESGTSMSAAEVSGVLSLMEDFFTNKLSYTPSPALMKALLINGARSVNSMYDFQVQKTLNDQGWGLINLTNSLPAALTNEPPANIVNPPIGGPGLPLLMFDQNPTNALATGDSRTVRVLVAPEAADQPLRFTLVWTDPPGDPAAGAKLVNDLDLTVTNNDTGDIYIGNDFPPAGTINFIWDTNTPPNVDSVNNVENVYLPPGVGTNFSVAVTAHRVNVNAVTAQTNNVSQDYALVISCGNGDVTNALTVADQFSTSANVTSLTQITNTFDTTGDTNAENQFAGALLLDQRVGANPELLGTNTVTLGTNPSWGTNGIITLGVTNQWRFYVMTNLAGLTNAAFVTFLPNNLAIPREGVFESDDPANATRAEADIDLYVARGPLAWGLTNLDPAVIAAADKSVGPGGTEFVAYTNATPNEVFYIGVKSEDQQAAEFGFLGLFSKLPFSSQGANGIVGVQGFVLSPSIPDGTPANPGQSLTIGLAVQPISVRRVVVRDEITHQRFADLFGKLSHNGQFAVLNNHSYPPGNPTPLTYAYTYEDNGEGDIPGSQPTDGPGSLRNFVGGQGLGVWMLAMVDNTYTHTGQVDSFSVELDPTEVNNGVATIVAGGWFYDYVDVPLNATNMTISLTFANGSSGPVDMFVRRDLFPDQNNYDFGATNIDLTTPTPELTIGINDNPPLQPGGRYYIGVHNVSLSPQTISITVAFGLNLSPIAPVTFTSVGNEPILDDAVTDSSIFVPDDRIIAATQVGLVIDHPRVSDLAITLISPSGTRVLLDENRGGTTDAGLGSTITTTNVFPVTTNGGFLVDTNILGPVPTSGTLVIDYNFFPIPDTLHVYYDNDLLFDSGLISGSNEFLINYSGFSTNITIVMNEGNNENSNTAWQYTASVISRSYSYLVFTEDTNLATIPIKFASPPFNGSVVAPPADVPILAGPTNNPATGHYYYLLDTNTWTGSEAWAEELGGHLVTINDADEQDWVYTSFAPLTGGNHSLWIGLNDVAQPGNFVWANGEPVTYTDWATGEPDNFCGNEDYVTMLEPSQSQSGFWNDADNVNTHCGDNSGPFPANGVVEVTQLKSNATDYLPEQTLDALKGEDALGEWRLELWDNRAGAPVPADALRSWQLGFVFEIPVPSVAPTNACLPAFPGAEGAGACAVGGRGGDVYHVVNLNDSGPGSLRYGVTSATGPRNIVFDVSGTIDLQSPLKFTNSFLTIAGQTAPGDGITTDGWVTSVEDGHDVIVRYLRFRAGDINCPDNQDDSFHTLHSMEVMVDHVTATWSIDEALSSTWSTNITVQWSMIAEPLNNSCHANDNGPGTQLHGYGSLLRYGSGTLSFHHDLYADNYSRNPRLGDNISLDFVNNVIFNWGELAGYSEDDSADNLNGYINRLNYVGNYLIAGTNTLTPDVAFRGGTRNTWIYQSGNLIDDNSTNVVLNGIDTGWEMFPEPNIFYTQITNAFTFPSYFTPVTTYAASEAYERVLAFAGTCFDKRDPVDTNIVAGVRTKSGIIIDSQTQVGGWPTLNSTTPPPDTDQDGMPDYWEITLGLNPIDPTDGTNVTASGYTELENYLNWLAAPHALTVTNTPVDVNLYVLAGKTGNLTFDVAQGTNGTVVLQTNGYIATFTPTNDYYGFASFGFSVTNTDTTNGFGPVTVSVMVSAVDIGTISIPTNVITLTNAIPYANTNAGGSNNIDYYYFEVSTNAARAQFEIDNPSGDMTLVARKGLPLPDLSTYEYISANPSTNNEYIVLFNGSSPVPLSPGSWFISAVNVSGGPVTYSIMATEWTNGIITLTNAVAYSASNDGVNTNDYYRFVVTSDAARAQFEINGPTADVTLVARQGTSGTPLPDLSFYDYLGTILSTNDQSIIVFTNSSPVPLSPGDWFLTAVNVSGGPVNYSITATEWPVTGRPIIITGTEFVVTSGTNSDFCLAWASLPGVQYYIEGLTNLTSTNWVVASPNITATDYFTTNCISLPSPLQYFRVAEEGGMAVSGYMPPPPITGVTNTPAGVVLDWIALADQQFQVQWTPSLAPPTWSTFTNIITSTNGVFTFTDDGSQSGGLDATRFYRLLVLP